MNRNKGYTGQSGYGSQAPDRFPQQEWSGDDYRGGHDYRADRPYAGNEPHAETGRFGSSHDDVGQRPRNEVGEYYGPSRRGAQASHDEGFHPSRVYENPSRGGAQERGSWNLGRQPQANAGRATLTHSAPGQADYDEERFALQQQGGGRAAGQSWDTQRGSRMQGNHASGYYGGVERGYAGYGSAMAGHDAASEQNFAGRGPRGYARSDERLKEDICEQLTHAPDIDASDIQVEVQGGKVVLSGEVSQRRMKHRAEDLVDCCAGVKEIDNRLSVARAQNTTHADSRSDATASSRVAAGSTARSHESDASSKAGNGHANLDARNGSPTMGQRKS